MTGYRYPTESWTLFLTFGLLAVLLLVAGSASLCLVPLAAVFIIALAYFSNRSHTRELLIQGQVVDPQETPRLFSLAQECGRRLDPGPVQLVVLPSRQVNAFTFGFENPKTVVLYEGLFKIMDETELQFIIGHELGHVALGHAWLNTLLGGMAGVPVSMGAAVVITLAFRWWNRACEYSADRAGLLACGSLVKSVSALAQLEVGDINTRAELQRAIQMIERSEDDLGSLMSETMSTHPIVARRIKELQKYASSQEYERLQAQISTRAA